MSDPVQAPEAKAPERCETMADVRYEIDRIDRLLVEILAERQSFMDAAARIKPDRSKVYDADRIEDVVAKVKAACQGAGLSPAIAEPEDGSPLLSASDLAGEGRAEGASPT